MRAAVLVGTLVVVLATGCGGGAAKTLVAAVKADPQATVAAEANVRAALPSTTLFFTDHASYVGMTVDALRAYDPGLSPTVSVVGASATSFCLQSTVRYVTASVTGPTGAVTDTPCP